MELEFFGAAGEVTGSCHILRVGGRQVLLDCGMIQGGKKQEQRNREPFPFQARDVDAVVLSHAHIDHSGRLPLLAKRGFSGPIYAHNATKDLCKVLLEDSAQLTERDTEWENRRRARKGLEPVEPLYTRKDARNALRRLRGRRYNEKVKIIPGVTARFRDAGHIMGSAIVEVWLTQGEVERKLVFSGDLGQHDAAILRDPTPIDQADLVLMESTYGGRVHRDRRHTVTEIGEIISEAQHHKGNILVPAFAVGRSQEVLYMLGKHYAKWGLKNWHVFLDSPMAIEASEIYWNYPHLYDDEATKFRRKVDEMPELKNLHLTPSPEESQVINKIGNGAIVIAGSGMCNGGRILHHLRHNVWRCQCHVVIVGYQAQGSLGRRLVDGSKFVRIHGEAIRVGAKIHTVGGLSAHGDRDDLLKWYRGFNNKPPVYLVHGDVSAAKAFSAKLKTECRARVTLTQPALKLDLTRLI